LQHTGESGYNIPEQSSGGSYSVSDRSPQQSIRKPESIKEYSFNPYVDPNNPDVRYSEEVIHKVEQTPQWDLRASAHLAELKTASTGVAVATRQKIEEGPLEEVANDQLISNKSVPARLEQELARERQYRAALAEQLQGQAKLTEEYARQLAEAKALAEESRQLRADVQAIKDAENKRIADEKAKADAEAASKSVPWYKIINYSKKRQHSQIINKKVNNMPKQITITVSDEADAAFYEAASLLCFSGTIAPQSVLLLRLLPVSSMNCMYQN
jgi:hypothetical protein